LKRGEEAEGAKGGEGRREERVSFHSNFCSSGASRISTAGGEETSTHDVH
jgi:hypothetical protein